MAALLSMDSAASAGGVGCWQAIGARVHVLVFAPSFTPAVKAGGPARSLTNLTSEAAQRHRVTVVACDRDHLDAAPFPGLSGRWVNVAGARVFYLNSHSINQWRELLRTLRSERFDLVLLNSVWSWAFSLVPAALIALRRLRAPAVLMPRGELEPGALALKSWKKNVVRPLVVALYRHVISAVGVTSSSEAGNAAVWFPNLQILITTNSPDSIEFGGPDAFHAEVRVVGLGRVHPTKGVLSLLAGLNEVTRPMNVRWYGAIADAAYWRQCKAAMNRLPLHVSFEYGGEARRTDISGILHNSDLMVLLTAGENYGHVIAESLQAGCPVMTTPSTPWTSVLREGGGALVIDREDAKAVGDALDDWASLGEEERARSRVAARRAFERFVTDQPPNIIESGLLAVRQNGKENMHDG